MFSIVEIFCPNFINPFSLSGIYCGPQEGRLLNDLMSYYLKLEKPVANESDAKIWADVAADNECGELELSLSLNLAVR